MGKNNEKQLQRTDWIILLALVISAVALRIIPGTRTIDDAYITYRYALNIVEGTGFVYNAGEAVLGTTTPLYTLLMAALAWISGAQMQAYPQISMVVNALAGGVSVSLLYLLGRKLFDHRLPGAALGFLWAVAPKSVSFAIGGMETSVFVALMLGAFTLWMYDRSKLSAALTALATLTRPDALIWAGPLALGMIVTTWQQRKDKPFLARLPWLEGGIYVLIMLPWLVFSTLTYGSPVSQSIPAKAVAYTLSDTQALVVFIQHMSTPFFEFDTFGSTGAQVGAILYPLLALLGALFLFHRDKRTLVLTTFPWLYALTYTLANPLIFRWYLAPPTPLYFLSIMAGVWGLAERLIKGQAKQWGMAGVAALWLATSLVAWDIHPDHGPDRPAPNMAWFKLELLYQEAALTLVDEVGPETVIAAGDIGAVGWYSGAYVLDTLGLITPQSVPYYPLAPEQVGPATTAIPPDLIADLQPDYIIMLEVYGRFTVLQDPRFAESYRLRETLDTDIYESDGMMIFERVDE